MAIRAMPQTYTTTQSYCAVTPVTVIANTGRFTLVKSFDVRGFGIATVDGVDFIT